jgi:hypothetical protein
LKPHRKANKGYLIWKYIKFRNVSKIETKKDDALIPLTDILHVEATTVRHNVRKVYQGQINNFSNIDQGLRTNLAN